MAVQRVVPVAQHVEYYVELDSVHDALAERFNPQVEAKLQDRRFITQSADTLERLAAGSGAIRGASRGLIRSAATALREAATTDRNPAEAVEHIAEAINLVRKALRTEFSAHQALLGKLADYGEQQLAASLVLAVVIPVATVGFLLFFRRRVLAPLNDLSYLMGLLSRKDYAAALTDKVDPMMAPLFDKYNRMVKRMRDLDEGHIKREDALQQDVDDATRALIQQQAALARAERMAAVGAVSARLAHDLRNPLSGVLMALTNLRSELDVVEQRERVGLVIGELERIVRLLNDLVDDSRQVPERPERLHLNRVIHDLVKLLRYQLSPSIALTTDVPEDIYCRLPEAGFRHVLLNLVMNAAQAIGQGPGIIEITVATRVGKLEVAIRDRGPGFPDELLETGIHEHGTWRDGGTGLGLAAARRFALEHGGRLELRTREGGGAKAVLILPVEDCDE